MGLRIFGDSFASHKLNPRLSRLTRKCKSQLRKRLKEIFQNLGSKDFGDSFMNQLIHVKHLFCTNRVKNQTVFQKFSLSLATRACLCLLRISLSKNHHFHSKNLHCSLQFSLQIQEKVWVFTLFYFISSLKHSISWICWFC